MYLTPPAEYAMDATKETRPLPIKVLSCQHFQVPCEVICLNAYLIRR
jgi:hypothetical protein